MELSNVLNYTGSEDWQIRAFAKMCSDFCEYKVDKASLTVTFVLDTKEKEEKYRYAFENFNWND